MSSSAGPGYYLSLHVWFCLSFRIPPLLGTTCYSNFLCPGIFILVFAQRLPIVSCLPLHVFGLRRSRSYSQTKLLCFSLYFFLLNISKERLLFKFWRPCPYRHFHFFCNWPRRYNCFPLPQCSPSPPCLCLAQPSSHLPPALFLAFPKVRAFFPPFPSSNNFVSTTSSLPSHCFRTCISLPDSLVRFLRFPLRVLILSFTGKTEHTLLRAGKSAFY